MARQQITIGCQMVPSGCTGSGPNYNVTYLTKWDQIGNDIDAEASGDQSGTSVSLSSDGTIVAIGARYNDGTDTNAGHVRVYEYNGSSWVQRGSDIDGEAANDSSGRSVSLSEDGSIVAVGAVWNDDGGTDAGHVRVYEWNGGTSAWNQKGGDIDGEAAGDKSGYSVSLSSDGNIVAIGAPYNGGTGSEAGHVRVYKYNAGSWSQQHSDIDGEAAGDRSGTSVSLSSDGSIVAIGAPLNDGVPFAAGHVRVYEDSGSAWSQIFSDIDGGTAGDQSGTSVSLSDDGTVVAIGSPGRDAGHVRVYENNGSAWVQKGGDIDGEANLDRSGFSVSLSSDGDVVAIGAYANGSNGHVRIYKYSGGSWVQKGDDIDGEAAGDQSGYSVSLSSDGSIVAIGAPDNDGTGTDAGHVRLYEYCSINKIQVGDWVYVNHEEAGNDGNILSVYTYQVTAIVDANTLTLKFISATNSYGDDSPCDLCDGTGTSATCGGIAPHTFKRDLGSPYIIFVE